MKKMVLCLLFAAAVILTAGCVTTDDSISGTWRTAEPVPAAGAEYTYTYTLVFNEDGTGTSVYEYSDMAIPSKFSITWEQIGENLFWYEEYYCFTVSDEGMVSSYGEAYTKDGESWVSVTEDGMTCTFLFNEDGTGVETITGVVEGKTVSSAYPFVWKTAGKDCLIYSYVYEYRFADNLLIIGNGISEYVFEKTDAGWVFEEEGRVAVVIFDGNTLLVKLAYADSGEEVFRVAPVIQNDDGESGIFYDTIVGDAELLEDGTLKIEGIDSVLRKVSDA